MRYRDLETGTFLTRDPIGYQDGPNIYCYVHCNPITKFDAWGLEARFIPRGFENYTDAVDVSMKWSEIKGQLPETLLSKIESKDTLTEIKVGKDIPRVAFGGFDLGIIDVSDIEALRNMEPESPEMALLHEVVEQYFKQNEGMLEASQAHQEARNFDVLTDGWTLDNNTGWVASSHEGTYAYSLSDYTRNICIFLI